MASNTYADYQVLLDGEVTLDSSTNVSDLTLNFTVPSDFWMGDGSRKPILAFKVAPQQDSSFKVSVNFRQVATFNLDKSHTRGLWEAFEAKTAFPEGASFSNPVPVKFFISTGKFTLSDVVLWYQIKV